MEPLNLFKKIFAISIIILLCISYANSQTINDANKSTGNIKNSDGSSKPDSVKIGDKLVPHIMLKKTMTQNVDKTKNLPSPADSSKGSTKPQRIGEHAPNFNDPDYDAKKAEWIRNYPQEYEQWIESKKQQNQQ